MQLPKNQPIDPLVDYETPEWLMGVGYYYGANRRHFLLLRFVDTHLRPSGLAHRMAVNVVFLLFPLKKWVDSERECAKLMDFDTGKNT